MMETNIELALSLMVIGMFTVFVILFMVVAGGKILIILINKFIPEGITHEAIRGDNKKLAAIIAAVNVVTGGKGKIEKINKIN